MPRISIITAAYVLSATYLPDAIAGVEAQKLAAGWELEWIVQEDGPEPSLADQFSDLGYVRYQANEARLGLAQTRNLALSRASGSLVQVLDHDDVLLPGALTTLAARFVEHPIHWAIGQADDAYCVAWCVGWLGSVSHRR